MRLAFETILILVIACQSMYSSSIQRELNGWKRECHRRGYAFIDTDEDGNVLGVRLKTRVELGLDEEKTGPMKYFVPTGATEEKKP